MKRHLQQYTLLVTCGVFLFLSIASTSSNQSLAADQNEYLAELTIKKLLDIEVITPARILKNAKKSAYSITVLPDTQTAK